MPGDTASSLQSAKTVAHLARVRDNQRRSRARRKEYLAELEDKFRRCEQAGVEATLEMQVAARQVLEENARLRAFLREKGHSEKELIAFTTRSPTGAETSIVEQVKATEPIYPSAAPSLQHMLKTRKPCCADESRCAQSTVEDNLSMNSTTAEMPPPASSAPPESQAAKKRTRLLPTRPLTQQPSQTNHSSDTVARPGPLQVSPQMTYMQQRRKSSYGSLRPRAHRSSDVSGESTPIGSPSDTPSINWFPSSAGMNTTAVGDQATTGQPMSMQHPHPKRPHPDIYSRTQLSLQGPTASLQGPYGSFSEASSAQSHHQPHRSQEAARTSSNPRFVSSKFPTSPSALPHLNQVPIAEAGDGELDFIMSGDFSDLLLTPELQAHFLRGLGMQQDEVDSFGALRDMSMGVGHQQNDDDDEEQVAREVHNNSWDSGSRMPRFFP